MNKINWDEIWIDCMKKASWRNWHRDAGCDDPNEHNRLRTIAEQYDSDSRARESRCNQSDWILSKAKHNSDMTIMDIGSGPGTLSIPLSRRARHVTAIDPSSEMLSCLRRRSIDERIENIGIINKKWEEIIPLEDVDPHDILVASYSLYMQDMRSALKKMISLANEYIFLFTFVGNPGWEYSALWPLFHGEEYNIGPDYIILYNILYDMGIYANIEVFDIEHIHSFASVKDCVDYLTASMNDFSTRSKSIIEEYASSSLRGEDNRIISESTIKTAAVWWKISG